MSSMRITQAVGLGGANMLADVKAVQTALNKLLDQIPPTKTLVVDGRLGTRPESSKTVAAIKVFQSKVVGMQRPDGKIDVNGRSHRKINEQLTKKAAVAAVPISGSLKVTLKSQIERYEGRVPHMYLDTKGFVTVGVGHLLKDAAAAKQIAFIVRETGQPASAKQIEEEFNKFKALVSDKNKIAKAYKRHSELIITDSLMDKQVEQHIMNFEKELKRLYGESEFQTYPDNVKLALFDMIFNLGMTTLKNSFPNFNKHIKARNFKQAALESKRKDVSNERNAYVKRLLEM